LGGSPRIAQARAVIDAVPHGIRVTRHVPDVPPPPFYQRMRSFSGNLDRWFIYDFVLPGTLLMRSGGRPAGQEPDDMRDAVQLHSCQTLTQETETTTHYFFQQSHRTGQGDEAITERIYQSLLEAFEEDRRMITAQARNIAHSPAVPMLPLAMDAALTQYRRII